MYQQLKALILSTVDFVAFNPDLDLQAMGLRNWLFYYLEQRSPVLFLEYFIEIFCNDLFEDFFDFSWFSDELQKLTNEYPAITASLTLTIETLRETCTFPGYFEQDFLKYEDWLDEEEFAGFIYELSKLFIQALDE